MAELPRYNRWWGWGDPAHDADPPVHAVRWLAGRLGVADLPVVRPPVALEDVRLAGPQVPAPLRAALEAAVGAGHVADDHGARVLRAGGKALPDLLRARSGALEDAPDVVVSPGSHEEVRAVLEACAEHGAAVVPFGGGTSVVGGVAPLRGTFPTLVSLDLGRLDRLVALDARSRVAVLEPGLRGPEAEALLAARGFTLGHFPQSFEFATVGGFVATRSAGQASTGYGRIDANVVGLRLAAPAGDLELEPERVHTAAGPSLRELVVGSEGTLGVLTQVALQVAPAPELRHVEAWVAPSFAAGAEVLRELGQAGLAPAISRLSDEPETAMNLALAGVAGSLRGRALQAYLRARGIREGALMLLGWEGTATAVRAARQAALPVLAAHGAAGLGRGPGRSWEHGRFAAPYLRDDLLDRGVLVETLETATTWSGLHDLHRRVGDALRAHCPVVACHVSHVYTTGASLYFTFLARQDQDDPLGQWHRVKTAASEAIVAAGGTITHHHAVGRDHAPYLRAEVGDLGLRALRALKAELDPAGMMNPGKLLPDLPDLA